MSHKLPASTANVPWAHIVTLDGKIATTIPVTHLPVSGPSITDLGLIVVRTWDYKHYLLNERGKVEALTHDALNNPEPRHATIGIQAAWFGGDGIDRLTYFGSVGKFTKFKNQTSALVAVGDGSLVAMTYTSGKAALRSWFPDGAERWSVALEDATNDINDPSVAADGSIYCAYGNSVYRIGD